MARKTNTPPDDSCPSGLSKKIEAETPKGLPGKPKTPDGFKEPVAWLGGRELIANLKLFALHALFGGKLDSRDWMTGVVNLLRYKAAPTPDAAKATEGEEMYTRVVEMQGEAADEFWFDYFADTGDGQMPVYNIAYLCMTDLYLSAAGGDVHLERQGGATRLPRGKFLFVGGDTGYHVADYGTLALRFQAPFWWAYRDLVCEGKIPESEMCERRPLFGIPANHDYYDALDGFNRQFRRPITGEDDKDERAPQLQLPAFERHQEASYVALQLPFGWWLWGIDTENEEIDFRQQKFFEKLGAPEKLILATPTPTTVFGKYLDAESKLAKVFEAINLRRPFLKTERPGELKEGECRLDLSGDVHHYARYFGPETEPVEAKRPRYKQNGDMVSSPNYASVVSGGGGAFFDPTNTYYGEIKEQAIFPGVEKSREVISEKILDYWNILRGGSVHYLGAFMAFITCFAAVVVPGSRDVLLGGKSPFTEWADLPGLLSVVVSILLLVLGHALLERALDGADKKARAGGGDDEEVRRRSAHAQTQAVWFLLLLPVPFMAFGLIALGTLRPFPHFGDSLMVFLSTAWAALMCILYVRYTEPLNERAKKGEVEPREFRPSQTMLVLAAVAFCSGLWLFGKLSPPAHLFAGVVFITVVLAVLFGLPAFAVVLGAARHDARGKVGYVFIGLWHAVLQLTVPVLWMLSAYQLRTEGYKWFFVGLLFIASVVFRVIGIKYVGRNNRDLMVVVWIIYGFLLVSVPLLYLERLPDGALAAQTAQLPVWGQLLLCVGAAIIGAMMSCVWFGWYLAVAMIFNGHNNEVGGAARLVGYKQFIRVRLTRNDLTAYVIGFDNARPEGNELAADDNLCLADYFTLTVK